MESNECVCVNLVNLLQNAINSLLGTTTRVMMNSNTPATDSGYMTNTNSNAFSQNPTNNTGLSTGFYSVLMIIGLMLLLMKLKNRGKEMSSTLSK